MVTTGLVFASAPAFAAGTSATTMRIGQVPTPPRGAVHSANPAPTTPLHLNVVLSPRDAAALSAFASSVSTPGSANYHHYLAKEQFASAFGPT